MIVPARRWGNHCQGFPGPDAVLRQGTPRCGEQQCPTGWQGWACCRRCAVLPMAALGTLGCQGGSQSPPAFQAACRTGSKPAQLPSTRPPQNTSHLSTGARQSTSPVCRRRWLMFTHMWRRVWALGADGRTALRTPLGWHTLRLPPLLSPSYHISH